LNATLSGTVPAGTTIIWYDNLVAGNVLGNGNSYTTPVLAAGTYSYYVGTCPGTYHQPVIVTVTNTTPISAGADVTICTGGNTTLNASGAATYAWSPSGNLSNPNISNPVANPASTTTYVVTGTSSCGTNTDTMIVTVGTMSASISGNTTICPGGSTTLTASGGNNYLWSTTQTTSSIIVSPTANTNYSVTVSSGSCSTSTSVTVTIGSAINASITGGNVTVCTGSNVSLSASGGTNYSWNTAQTTSSIVVSPTANSTYSVFVSSGSCADTATTSITVSSGITASINGPAAICSGGNATLTASGGNNYSWNTAQTTSSIVVSPTANSTYSVFVSSGSCADTTSITVNVGSSITALVTANSTICSGQNATLTASGGSNYSWTTGNTNASINVSPTANTTYSVIVSSGSCADTASTVVSVAPAPALSLSGNTSICIGDVSTITASGGNNYSWSTGATTTSVLLSPTTTTNYSVTAFGALCDSTAPFTITVVPQANVTVSPNTTICAGASTTLSAQGGATYSWSTTQTTSSIIISPTATSTYSVIGGFGSCKDTATVTVFVSPSPTVSITSNPSPASICSGASATLNATGGGNYSWSNSSLTSSTTVSPNATTTYTVFVTSNGCTSTATATVNVIATPSVNIAGNPNICSGTPTILTAQGATNYSWSTGQSSTSITVSSSGTYSVFAAIGTCTTSSSITVNTAPSPTATVSAPVIITQGGSANLTAGGGVNYVWDNGMNGQNITVSPSVTTVYCVTVYDNNGCQDSACTKVMVEVCSGEPYFPNAFSPNGDGDNDSLMVYYNIPDCIKKLHLVIYNRWGEKVYETSDVNFRWNGNYTTSLIKGAGETEVLAFYLDIEIAGGTSISKKGNVSLIR
jgi:gliding motility-associated-like protein